LSRALFKVFRVEARGETPRVFLGELRQRAAARQSYQRAMIFHPHEKVSLRDKHCSRKEILRMSRCATPFTVIVAIAGRYSGAPLSGY
jgi:hypothetical protein